jgi:hypothetical protein
MGVRDGWQALTALRQHVACCTAAVQLPLRSVTESGPDMDDHFQYQSVITLAYILQLAQVNTVTPRRFSGNGAAMPGIIFHDQRWPNNTSVIVTQGIGRLFYARNHQS